MLCGNSLETKRLIVVCVIKHMKQTKVMKDQACASQNARFHPKYLPGLLRVESASLRREQAALDLGTFITLITDFSARAPAETPCQDLPGPARHKEHGEEAEEAASFKSQTKIES